MIRKLLRRLSTNLQYASSRPGDAGFTLVEVIIAFLLITVVVGGTMGAMVTAGNVQATQHPPAMMEAAGYVKQALDEISEHVDEDDTWFASQQSLGWQPLPFIAAGSESIQRFSAVRKYCVKAMNPVDCNGVGNPADCYAVQTRVCWNGTACPADGDPCP